MYVTGANLLANPDFSANAASFCSQTFCILSDASAIAPWTFTNGPAFELDSPAVWAPYSGGWSMDLCANVAYTIQQQVTLDVGKPYELDVEISENPCGPSTKTGFISATGSAPQSFTHDSSDPTWKRITYHFVATAAQTTISIGGTNTGSCGPVVGYAKLVGGKAPSSASPLVSSISLIVLALGLLF
ncbi:hypothetical protein HK103_006842 [Boothiomyces macroporosus]|uniref:DUF642 domain-containing protein n=1 Tax=Boothiomyces macroporosus TaxID=261099 RepID=A0AAD5Y1T0_9FUNG|nr:hypothetical protein HK103_006842 [Boothiomyces macroporosus]